MIKTTAAAIMLACALSSRPAQAQQERRHKGKLKVGVDIPNQGLPGRAAGPLQAYPFDGGIYWATLIGAARPALE